MQVMRLISTLSTAVLFAAALMVLTPQTSAAQDKLQRVDAFEFWSVFVDEGAPQKYCYAATVPTDTQISQPIRGRGDAYLLVSTFPAASVSNEISVKLGFPADPNRPPSLRVDGQNFRMFSDGEEAWLEDPSADTKVVSAMRRGARAVVVSTSQRGTVLTDTYSLIGFTDSLGRVRELCP